VTDKEKDNEVKKTCEVCEGSGQICEFRGVSRFVLTWDNCPVCGGLGFIVSDKDDGEKDSGQPEEIE
jgi:DnaJ-class molecular chaperone